jgi:sugar phosphate isomerase/epimerase
MTPKSPMDRRTFVRSLSAAAAASLAGPAAAAARAPGRSALEPVGIQLYTVRSLLSADVEGTIAAIAGIGYKEVEFAGLAGRTAAGMRAILERNGIRAVASHHSMRDVREGWPKVLEDANALGQRYVLVASLGGADRASLDGIRAVADAFNRAGEAAKAAGLQFAYHNHDFEFRAIDGVMPYDLLLERCDAQLVQMEMDLFWIVNGGQDPLSYFAKHPGRFPLVHVKDRTADGQMVNVGAGVIDFRGILGRASQAGIRHWLVEHDRPSDPLADVRASYEYLRGI